MFFVVFQLNIGVAVFMSIVWEGCEHVFILLLIIYDSQFIFIHLSLPHHSKIWSSKMSDKSKSPPTVSTFTRLFNQIKPRKHSITADTSEGGDNSISLPTAVQHNFHCGVDAQTNQITGLPPSWLAWLAASTIRWPVHCMLIGCPSICAHCFFLQSIPVTVLFCALLFSVMWNGN